MTGWDSGGLHEMDPGPSILLLEDDESLRQMLTWELSDLGYHVIAVSSCREARAAMAMRDFDLALFDIELHDGDGAELAAELMEQRPELRVVLCSGKHGNSISEHLRPKLLAYLTKPVSIHQLDDLFRNRSPAS